MLLARYQALLAEGKLEPDRAQESVARKLDNLQQELAGYRRADGRGILSRLMNGNGPREAPKSVYIWGDVGRGKTMLMDLFMETAPVAAGRRVHFHAFMQDVHARIFAVRQSPQPDDAVLQVAAAIGRECVFLCLDEMQINDIADAMIIGRLFETLLAAGTVTVTTSNVAPGDLYRDGLNRQLFLPFVRLIEKKFDILAVAGGRDFRLGRVKGHETFITPLSADADAQLQAIWEQLTETRRGTAESLEVNGRKLAIPQASRGCTRFSFAELCGAALGPADYLAIARSYRTVFIERIPRLGRDERNEARRMIAMIDTFYDAGTRLVATSEEPPRAIYSAGSDQPDFARTVSRLEEMQSAGWWEGQTVPA